jgi:hypothetical protein
MTETFNHSPIQQGVEHGPFPPASKDEEARIIDTMDHMSRVFGVPPVDKTTFDVQAFHQLDTQYNAIIEERKRRREAGAPDQSLRDLDDLIKDHLDQRGQ